MTPKEFVSCVRCEILESNLSMYRESLERSLAETGAIKSHWPQMGAFYRTLTDEQRQQIVAAIRQVMVDTLSNMLGVLDGASLLEKHRDYFHLTYGDEPHEINGELQDYFLAAEQENLK